MTKKEELTKQEKITLLKNFLADDICVKAIIDTLDDVQLDNWINQNMDTLLVKNERGVF